ncbi:MAG TPA: hypothetical protein PLT76_04055 [Candidatus Omnitrophota bacterium]|nr:hypothetical protein [Candidatus Omnitrophota bacterium]HPB67598.1 hypothetical protein [Candidatus Omnitrophota bacterium]HQO57875.1 hypothetical protein [Candidatus Omnitrophota bacterium]HQP11479.1 hypothetical protein [Candidatus Omnitrophota bacterium]
MNKIDVFDVFFDGFSYTWKHQLLQGVLFLLFGVVIVLLPQLLVAMVASFFVVIGLILIGSAWTMRRFRKQYDGFRSELFEIF